MSRTPCPSAHAAPSTAACQCASTSALAQQPPAQATQATQATLVRRLSAMELTLIEAENAFAALCAIESLATPSDNQEGDGAVQCTRQELGALLRMVRGDLRQSLATLSQGLRQAYEDTRALSA